MCPQTPNLYKLINICVSKVPLWKYLVTCNYLWRKRRFHTAERWDNKPANQTEFWRKFKAFSNLDMNTLFVLTLLMRSYIAKIYHYTIRYAPCGKVRERNFTVICPFSFSVSVSNTLSSCATYNCVKVLKCWPEFRQRVYGEIILTYTISYINMYVVSLYQRITYYV